MFPENQQPQPAPVQQQPIEQPQPAPVVDAFATQPQQQQPQQQPVQQPDYQQPVEQPAPQPTDFEQAQQQQYQPVQTQQPEYQPPVDQPQQQPVQQPVAQPVPQAAPTGNPQVVPDMNQMDSEFEVWLDKELPLPPLPNIADVPGDDPNALNEFFVNYDNAIRSRGKIETAREGLKQEKEAYLWNEVYTTYPNLQRSPNVDRTVRTMFAGARAMGRNVTPLQIAQEYARSLGTQYSNGYQAQNTQVQIRQSQPMPTGGQGQPLPQPAISNEDMASLQTTGGDAYEAAANIAAKLRQRNQAGFN